jgi:hypothetical protein
MTITARESRFGEEGACVAGWDSTAAVIGFNVNSRLGNYSNFGKSSEI